MNTNRANWSDVAVKLLLDLCIDQKRKLNFNSKGPTKIGWQHIYKNFKHQSGLNYDDKQIRNKLTALRGSYLKWRDANKASGLGRDRNTGGVTADDSYFSQEGGQGSSGHLPPPHFLEELEELYRHTTIDRGILITAGGVSEATPTTETEVTPEDSTPMSHDLIGASNVRTPERMPTWEDEVNSPSKKRGSSSLEDYIRDISESVKMRAKRRISRDAQELDEVMHILEADGIPESSELYLQALYLCKNAMNRRAFTKLKTKEGRLNWICFNWEHK